MSRLEIFDESKYFDLYPDVHNAYLSGIFISGYDHYINYGESEGRNFPVKIIDSIEMHHENLKLFREFQKRQIFENFYYLAPKITKKPIVIFFTPRSFEGNLKYVYLEFIRLIKTSNVDIDCYLLTTNLDTHQTLRDAGFPSIFWRNNDLTTVKILLESAVLVDDGFYVNSPSSLSLLYACLSSAYRVNLWHGTPMRKIALQSLDCVKKIDLHYSSVLRSAVSNNTFCGSSECDERLFRAAMVIDEYVVTGYAKNDVFYREIGTDDLINVDQDMYENLSSKDRNFKVVLYAPTWREDRVDWIKEIDLARFSQKLALQNIKLIVNLHPFEMSTHASYLRSIPGIMFISPGTDIYPIIKYVDLLISDYSSIVFDFLHAKRPIVYFRPDHQEYLANNRGFEDGRIGLINAPTCSDLESCADIVLNAIARSEINFDENILIHAHTFYDKNSSYRCVKTIEAKVKNLLQKKIS